MTEIYIKNSHVLPAPSPLALLGAPQGSLLLVAPSPNGSPEGDKSAGGAGVPHASSDVTGAEAEWKNKTDVHV